MGTFTESWKRSSLPKGLDFPRGLAVEASSLPPSLGPALIIPTEGLSKAAPAPGNGSSFGGRGYYGQPPTPKPFAASQGSRFYWAKLWNPRWAVAGLSLSPSGQCPLRLISRCSFHPAPSESGPGCSAPGTSPCHCCRLRSGSAACKAHMPCLNPGWWAASCSALSQPKALCPCSEQTGSRRRPTPPASKNPPLCGHHFGSDPRVSLQRPGIVGGDTWQGLSTLPSTRAEATGKQPLPTEGLPCITASREGRKNRAEDSE